MHRLWKHEPLRWRLRSPERVLSSSIQIRVNFSSDQRGSALGKLCALNSVIESSGSAVNTEPCLSTRALLRPKGLWCTSCYKDIPVSLFPRVGGKHTQRAEGGKGLQGKFFLMVSRIILFTSLWSSILTFLPAAAWSARERNLGSLDITKLALLPSRLAAAVERARHSSQERVINPSGHL